jgi:hypothetical protein
MKNRWQIFSSFGVGLFIVLMLCITVNARADVVVPGTKTIEYCAQFTGIPDFPNYVFLAIDPGGTPKELTQTVV